LGGDFDWRGLLHAFRQLVQRQFIWFWEQFEQQFGAAAKFKLRF
jgi:hypothetical protein